MADFAKMLYNFRDFINQKIKQTRWINVHEWIKKNNEKVIYGLAILVVILLIWGFSTLSTRISLTQEIEQLNSDKAALSMDTVTKNKIISDANEMIDELSQRYEAAKTDAEKLTAEIAQLNAANGELSEKVTTLDASLSDGRNEVVRLSNANLALTAESAAKSGTIADEREKLSELTRDYDESLAAATLEIERLDFVALLREKNVENLTNEVTALKQVEAELRGELEAADAKIKQLEDSDN